jgi:hypothetical protein
VATPRLQEVLSGMMLASALFLLIGGAGTRVIAAGQQPAAPSPVATPAMQPPGLRQPGAANVANYVGSQACMGCHQAGGA